MKRALSLFLCLVLAMFGCFHEPALACTGLALEAVDGTIVYGRTMEWGAFDLKSRVVVIPKGHEFHGQVPHQVDGGISWNATLGVVGIDALEKEYLVDGMNEKGLAVGAFYLPGFAEFQSYEPKYADHSLSSTELGTYLLTQFATVAQVREGLKKVRVVPVDEPAIGNEPVPLHWMVVDKNGDAIAIEYLEGELHIFEDDLRVITNAPSFDWHLTNLRNYIYLSPVELPPIKLEGGTFKPLGAGSGFLGLPGDFTPPSRFIRVVAYTQTARDTFDGDETLYEVLRILDNFSLPVVVPERPSTGIIPTEMRSATLWTSAADTGNLRYYYHTQHNRRLRMVDLNKIEFASTGEGLQIFPLDEEKSQDIDDITPTSRKPRSRRN